MKFFKLQIYIVAVLGIVFLMIRFFTPGHIQISDNSSLGEIRTFIKSTMKKEARNISFENLNSSTRGGIPAEHLKAIDNLIGTLDKCQENKECLITTYDKYMDKWASQSMRKQSRAYYMIKSFGVVGEKINKTLGFMY